MQNLQEKKSFYASFAILTENRTGFHMQIYGGKHVFIFTCKAFAQVLYSCISHLFMRK